MLIAERETVLQLAASIISEPRLPRAIAKLKILVLLYTEWRTTVKICKSLDIVKLKSEVQKFLFKGKSNLQTLAGIVLTEVVGSCTIRIIGINRVMW